MRHSIPGRLQLRGGRHVAVREPRAYWHDTMGTFSSGMASSVWNLDHDDPTCQSERD